LAPPKRVFRFGLNAKKGVSTPEQRKKNDTRGETRQKRARPSVSREDSSLGDFSTIGRKLGFHEEKPSSTRPRLPGGGENLGSETYCQGKWLKGDSIVPSGTADKERVTKATPLVS